MTRTKKIMVSETHFDVTCRYCNSRFPYAMREQYIFFELIIPERTMRKEKNTKKPSVYYATCIHICTAKCFLQFKECVVMINRRGSKIQHFPIPILKYNNQSLSLPNMPYLDTKRPSSK